MKKKSKKKYYSEKISQFKHDTKKHETLRKNQQEKQSLSQ